MSERIENLLAWLQPHTLSRVDPLELRGRVEDLHDGAQDDLYASLRSATDAAVAWGVGERRARAHIARLHEKYGIGRRLGGSWVLRQSDIEHHPPDARYRTK